MIISPLCISILFPFAVNGFSVRSSFNGQKSCSNVRLPTKLRDSSAVSVEDSAEDIEKLVTKEEELNIEENKVDENEVTNSPQDMSAIISKILALASATGRGEFAKISQKDQAEEWIKELELNNPTPEPTNSPLARGTWELVYSNTQLFRSSPFFMAGRATCSTPEEAKQYDWFCDMHRAALAISNIGAVRQIISDSRLVSEFEVKAGAVPFLNDFTPFSYSGGWPVTIDGAIVSSADITPTGEGWEIYMDTVEIKGSNIPGVRQVLDNGIQLESRGLSEILENNVSSYSTPKPVFKTTYLSDTLRVSRDQDGKVFVYSKSSESEEPTDYSSVLSDLGVTSLLEGFNDAITKFYI